MRRRQWIELHDQQWFPESLRDLVTDTLQFFWNFFDFYAPIAPRLQHALNESGTHRILDLCSGGGGPWLSLIRKFEDREASLLEVCLTDRFPNPEAFERAKSSPHTNFLFHVGPVDATRVPTDLEGFRTLFTSFHHFPPEGAQAILEDAVKHRRGVGVFEVARRNWLTIFLVFFIAVMTFVLAPLIRPFRWSRLLWTYVIPVIPFVMLFDGIVSCLRAYTPPELLAFTHGLSENGYRWEAGEAGNGLMPVPVTFLIGYPVRSQDHAMS